MGDLNRRIALITILIAPLFLTIGCKSTEPVPPTSATPATTYTFEHGFPTAEQAQRIYDEADLNRAVEAYRFFYPGVSMAGLFGGFQGFSSLDNKTFFYLEGRPNQILFTPNSDTPYAVIPLDLSGGPITVELPPCPLIGVANDLNFRWVIDMGVPGPDAGKGGKHIILPPGWKGTAPTGYYTGQSTTNHVFLIIRSLPVGGDLNGALGRFPTIKIRPLNPPAGWTPPTWTNVTEKNYDATPLKWETNIQFWEQLHRSSIANRPTTHIATSMVNWPCLALSRASLLLPTIA
jgi:hypothetical protein